MPELPEVETIRRQLQRSLGGGRIEELEVLRAGVVISAGGVTPASLAGAPLGRVRRRGKLLILEAGERILLLHLRMTGHPEVLRERRPGKHTHFILRGQDRRGKAFFLHFHDPRRFGRLWLLPAAGVEEIPPLCRVGRDALAVTPREFRALLSSCRGPLKPFLLDQGRVAGIGNIYADEILHRCGLHPLTPAASLGPERALILHGTMREVLRRAIQRGGSSVRDYVQATGERGSFQEEHSVYGRRGKPCPACATPVRRITLGGRGTHYCPSCQPKPRGGRKP